MKKRILEIGFENFLIPERISDQKIATAISILRELTPCDHYGNERKGREATHEVTLRCFNRPKQDGAEVPLELAVIPSEDAEGAKK